MVVFRWFLSLSIFLVASASTSQSQLKMDAIFQFESAPTSLSGFENQPLQKMTFGLSAEQMNQIHQLTDGRVNFKNIYRLKVQDISKIKALKNVRGFTDLTDSTVPPPALFEDEKTAANMDPEYKGQWWVRDIFAEDISELSTGNGITIADCDAGYFWDASDLEKNMLYDLRYDFADKDDPYTIDDGGFASHGTSVSAIMAGVLDGHGTNGLAYDAKVVPLQNYNYAANDDINKEEATALCVLHAMKIPEVSIIVLENQTSTGSSETFVGTRNAVRLAIEAGIHVVSAAGNYSKELVAERNDDTGSVIVGALEPSGETASFSNYGERINVAAFGREIHTLRGRDGEMGNFGGTSGATPQVAGAVALMLEVNPDLSPAQVRSILESTRREAHKSARVGGRLDVRSAVEMASETEADQSQNRRAQQLRQALNSIL